MPSARTLRNTLLMAVAFFAPFSTATTTDDLKDPNLYAIADGRAYPVKPVQIMLNAARSTKAEATVAQMIDSLIDNQIIAAQALREYGRERMTESTKVGYETAVILEDQYSLMMRMHYREQLNAFVKSLPGSRLDGILVEQFKADDPAIKELMTQRDVGEVRLTPSQMELARKTRIATLRMPDGRDINLTYADIYRRQHVQGRVKLLQDHDTDYLLNQIKSRAEFLFVNWWAETKSGLTRDEITLLNKLLEEKYIRGEYLLETGVATAMHEDTTPTLEKLQKQVTQAEITAWYKKHKEDFKQVDRVLARHIKCRTEEDCTAARKAIEAGMDFSEAVRKYSIAPSKTANPAGSLGWITRKDNKLGWLGEVAMIGHLNEMTGPIREPQDENGNADWQLVRVDERVETYSPVDSDTVRYQARAEIARKKAIERFKVMLEKKKAAMVIRRNPALIAGRAPNAF